MSDNLQRQLALLPDYLAAHVLLSLAALGIGIAISLPLGVAAARHRALRGPALAVASVIQTVPSLAVLALMVAAFGLFGLPAALIALTAYSLLPVLRNTVTGIEGVDPAVVEAARGIGMTPNQILTAVQLPLAAPVIIAGVRTATVWVVGIATLSTPVGATSLGNYIFGGLQTRNTVAVLVGVAAAAALALVLDALTRLLERAVADRSRALTAGAVAALAAIAAGALVAPALANTAPTRPADEAEAAADAAEPVLGRPVVVGAKTFTEQFILADLITRQLQRAGYTVEQRSGLGSTIVFDALTQNDVDVYVDYTGTIWANHMQRDDTLPGFIVLSRMTAWLAERHSVLCLGPLGFENAYAFALRAELAHELGVTTISELTEHDQDLSIGGDYEFFDRPEWAAFQRVYGLGFDRQVSFDSTLMYPAAADGDVDVITAFTSDGRIDAYDLALLKDDRQAFPPYDAVLLVGPEAARDERLLAALAPLVAAISDDAMRAANRLVDVDRADVPDAADALDRDISGR